MKKNQTLLLLLTVFTLFASCSKDDDSDNSTPVPPTASTPSTVPVIADANGVLVSVKSITWTINPFFPFPVISQVGTAVAVFSDSPGSSTFVNAGNVQCESNFLTRQGNNSYVFTPSATAPTGISFNTNPEWVVQGAGSIPALNRITTMGFPSGIDSVSNGATINKNNDYTLNSAGNITNSDSVLFIVAGPSATLSRTLPGNTVSCTFSANEMATIGAGNGIIQIAPYNVESTTTGGKKFYLVNEVVVSRNVTIN